MEKVDGFELWFGLEIRGQRSVHLKKSGDILERLMMKLETPMPGYRLTRQIPDAKENQEMQESERDKDGADSAHPTRM